jgi:hypothetical protein
MAQVTEEDLLELNAILTQALQTAVTLRESWDAIKWQSSDLDNMEFQAKITCFQRDQIETLFALLLGKSGV